MLKCSLTTAHTGWEFASSYMVSRSPYQTDHLHVTWAPTPCTNMSLTLSIEREMDTDTSTSAQFN